MTVLRVLATIISGPMLLWGILGVIQGLAIFPSLLVPGSTSWAFRGVFEIIIGVALVWWVNKRR